MTKKRIIIKLEEVWKTYKMGEIEVHALRGMEFEVREGEFVAIMGPSGSGKSTAVNMIGCLDIPTKGEIYLENKDIAHLSESELAQIRGQKIGFIFQQFNLIPTLTAKENVMLPMIFQGTPYKKRIQTGNSLGKRSRPYESGQELPEISLESKQYCLLQEVCSQ